VEVRAAAVRALAAIRGERGAELMRAHLHDRDPRVAVIAAVTLAGSSREEDLAAAEGTLQRLAGDTRDTGAEGRRQVAAALGQIPAGRFRPLLVPLMFDPDVAVAREAVRSAGRPGEVQELLLPPLVSLLRRRPLRSVARSVLVSRGEGILDVLGYFLRDETEDIEVRRQIPATLARIPSPRSVELLLSCLGEADEPLRDEALAALERLRREQPALSLTRGPVEQRVLAEARRYFRSLSLLQNLVRGGDRGSLLRRALEERLQRSVDRVYRLLGLLYPWRDVMAARRGMEGDVRARARAAEYLDNLLGGPLRQWLMPLLEDIPSEDRARKGNALLKTRARDVEDTLAQLIHDEDQTLSAAAIHRVEEEGLWGLADDLEHVLAHRDSRDWLAFEAASWVLAAQRITAEGRRARWRESLPAVEAAHRLRAALLLRFASVDALIRIASAGRTLRPEPGQVLLQEGTATTELHLLLEGSVIASQGQMPPAERTAPLTLGLEAVLGGERTAETVRAGGNTLCLVLGAPEALGLLAEDVGLTQALFRAVLDDGMRGGTVLRSRGRWEASRLAGPSARTLEQVRLLEASPLFRRTTADQLLRLAQIAREEPLVAGSTLFEPADPAALYVLDHGEVAVETEGGEPTRAGAGDTLGARDVLAGARGGQARVTAAGSALRIDGEALLELVVEDPDLLRGLFGALRENGSPGDPPSRL
jgi:HEAT repeat protein